MNHRPFEDWLLEDRSLNSKERQALEAHLHTCRSCAAIAESNLALHSARRVSAPVGFAERFEKRLDRWQARQKWLQLAGTVVLVAAALAVLYAVVGMALEQALRAPADWLTAGAVYMVFVVETLQVVSETGGIILRDLLTVLSPASWVALVAAASAVAAAAGWWASRMATIPQGARS
jgi:hypothetical protein